MSKIASKATQNIQPQYTLSIQGAIEYFNLTRRNFNNLIYDGWIHRRVHYLNIGRKPLIIREAFIEWLESEEGKTWSERQEQKEKGGRERGENKMEEETVKDSRCDCPPYSLGISGASGHFGLAAQTLYHWIHDGRLHRGIHYLKVGSKVLIIREAFIEFLRQEDGAIWMNTGTNQQTDNRRPGETSYRQRR